MRFRRTFSRAIPTLTRTAMPGSGTSTARPITATRATPSFRRVRSWPMAIGRHRSGETPACSGNPRLADHRPPRGEPATGPPALSPAHLAAGTAPEPVSLKRNDGRGGDRDGHGDRARSAPVWNPAGWPGDRPGQYRRARSQRPRNTAACRPGLQAASSSPAARSKRERLLKEVSSLQLLLEPARCEQGRVARLAGRRLGGIERPTAVRGGVRYHPPGFPAGLVLHQDRAGGRGHHAHPLLS